MVRPDNNIKVLRRMSKYEVNFSGWMLFNDDTPEEAKVHFLEWMAEDYPELDIDRVISIEEVK